MNYTRPVGERPGERHPLRFAAGKLFGQSMLAVADLEIVEQLNGTVVRAGCGSTRSGSFSNILICCRFSMAATIALPSSYRRSPG
jgi:hypothetical protein